MTTNRDRIVDVDRSSGDVIFIRPALSQDPDKTHLIYAIPAKGDQPDDMARFANIDSAYTYLQARHKDKDLVHTEQLKAAFAAGVFVGVTIIIGIFYYLGWV